MSGISFAASVPTKGVRAGRDNYLLTVVVWIALRFFDHPELIAGYR